MYKALEKFFALFQKLMLGLITLALAAMMCVIVVQVFTRYVIFYSLPWSEELSRYLFVFIVVCGINIAVSREKLIKIDAVQNSFKSLRARLGFDIMRIFKFNPRHSYSGRYQRHQIARNGLQDPSGLLACFRCRSRSHVLG